MTRKLRISVTAADIAEGMPQSPTHCPIALAVRRALESYEWVSVGLGVCINDKFWALPRSGERFIARFDKSQSVKPFAFFLSRPSRSP